MIFAQDRHGLRRLFFEAWRKARVGGLMQPLEVQIAEVVAEHPEYHAALEHPDATLDKEYLPETGESNPFLHLALHLAVRDQLATDRPPGIGHALHALAAQYDDRHAAEHVLLACLAETLWEAQRSHGAPDEAAYLERIRRRAGLPPVS